MSRPGSSARPTHIALPTNTFQRVNEVSPSNTPVPLASPTSPRSSFLPNFIRNRSRAATITGRASPRAEQPDPMVRAPVPVPVTTNGTGTVNGRDGGGVTRSISTPSGGGLAAPANGEQGRIVAEPTGPLIDVKGKTHRIRLVPHLETSRSLAFDPVIRELYPIAVHSGITPSVAASKLTNLGNLTGGKPPALVLKIGRFTDKTPAGAEADRPATGIGGATITISGGGGEVTSGKIAFKSKVVSRTHAEIWCEAGGKFFIRDTSSSSGTFLNHIRLSSPNTDSRPTQLSDGDVLQLGVDYQGGHEDQFRCVKMRVELGREWQRAANEFNTNALKQLKALGGAPITPDSKGKSGDSSAASISKKSRGSVTDCCICLFSVTVCQSLFIAPCSHVFHYKCIRPLLQQHHPGFSCPLCRTFANLEEDVEIDDPPEVASRRTSSVSRRRSNPSLRLTAGVDPISPTGAGQANPLLLGENIDLADAPIGDAPTGEGESASEDGGRTEDETRHSAARLDQSEDVEMASDSREASVAIPDSGPSAGAPAPANGLSTATALSRGAEARRQAILESSRRNSGMGFDPLHTAGGMPEVQTPMNEYFLSTLAPGGIPVVNPDGMLGVQQQLDGADGGRSSRRGSAGFGHGAETTLAENEEDQTGGRRRAAEDEMMS